MSQGTQINPKTCHRPLLVCTMLAVILIGSAQGQTTGFTYQGRLTDAGNPATSSYDMQFKLFDSADFVQGNQVGSTVTRLAVEVTNGVFTVQLDFGAGVFDGSARFLEISLRPAGSPNALNVLSPRQPVTSTPYAVRSATAGVADTATNALQLAGMTASGFIQNTSSQQSATNFNIGGTGSANILSATTQFNLGGSRILSNAGTNNFFAGIDAGASNTTGSANAFFGKNSGQVNTTGSSNSFVGYNAGAGNTTGSRNSFFGDAAGFRNAAANNNSFFGFLAGFNNTANENSFFGYLSGADNTTGVLNSFFGAQAGQHNTTGFNNAFFGQGAGFSNTTGCCNSLFGVGAGASNTTGAGNSFFGRDAGFFNTTGSRNFFVGPGTGLGNTTGSDNTIIGAGANVGANNLTFATAIGAGAVVNTSNTVVLGRNTDTVQIPGALNAAGTFGASVISATTQFNLGGQRILSVQGQNSLYVGPFAGASNTTGDGNSFFGSFAGERTTTGGANSFFGFSAGDSNTTGEFNSFFGLFAGRNNITSSASSFFGASAGFNSTGGFNSFFGQAAGHENTTGFSNTFIGAFAGDTNTIGANNTVIGRSADVGANNLINATAIGANAIVSQSNSLVLGNGVNVGIGTTAPDARLHIAENESNTRLGNPGCGPGLGGIGFILSWNCSSYTMLGGDGNTYINRALGGAVIFREANGPNQVEIRPGGFVGLAALDGGGSTQLCRNGVAAISTCSSSLRYKSDVNPFAGGLDLIKRLRPITFTWKEGGMRDLGFAAEEVAKVEPLLVTHNAKGEVEGVKYDRITVALVNTARQQQAQIEEQRTQVKEQQQQLDRQQLQIDALKKLVCAERPDAAICKSIQ